MRPGGEHSGGGRGGGGGAADIKSNNPHLTGGEIQVRQEKVATACLRNSSVPKGSDVFTSQRLSKKTPLCLRKFFKQMKEKGIVLSAPNLSQKLKTALIIVLSWGSGSRLLKDTEIDRERERGVERWRE